MSDNKYEGNGELKEQVLLGLVKKDGRLEIKMDKDAPMSELIRFWGILSVEVPFMMQFIKSQQAKKDASGIVVPTRG